MDAEASKTAVAGTPAQGAQSPQGAGTAGVRLSLVEGIALIVGSNIGSGILALPYAARFAGWPSLVFWLVVAGFFTTVSMLYLAEVSLRTKEPLEFPRLAERYTGTAGASIAYISMFLNCINCIISYTRNSGVILADWLGVPNIFGAFLFAIPSVLVIWFGLKAVARHEVIFSALLVLIIAAFVGMTAFSGKADWTNIAHNDLHFELSLFGSTSFCFVAQYAVPGMAQGMADETKRLSRAITIGMLVTGVLLAVLPASIIALTGLENVTTNVVFMWGQVLGNFAFALGGVFVLCAMITSYWTVGHAMLASTVELAGLPPNYHRRVVNVAVLFCVAVPPFLLAQTNLLRFVDLVSWAGSLGCMFMCTLPALMLRKARKDGDVEPSWKCGWYAHPVVFYSMVALFTVAAAYSFITLL